MKISTMLLAVLLVSPLATNTKVSASENNKVQTETTIELTDSQFDTMLETGEAIYLGNLTWAKVETFDEMVNNISESKNITKEEIIEQVTDSDLEDIKSSLAITNLTLVAGNSTMQTG